MIHYFSPNGLGSAWIGNEIRRVDEAGIPYQLHALRKPDSTPYFESEWFSGLHRGTRVIYPIPPLAFLVSLACAPFLFGRRLAGCAWNALTGERESLRNRVVCAWHLLVACHWARCVRSERISLIHSQWIHSAGSVAWYGARLLGVPFSFTGHATDLFRNRVALKDKVRDAEFIVCISNFHRELFLSLGARDEQLVVAYCGIDISHFAAAVARHRDPSGSVRILSSGRLVEKKGFEYLIDACAELRRRGLDVRCVIGGSGPLEADLRRRVAAQGVSDVVEVTGRAISQDELPAFMAGGDVYCLPCVWARDDDVDGLPQMLMEAMACGLPAVSTRLVGIPDLVIDGETGLLVEPRQVGELADALQRLCEDEALAARLASNGRAIVERRFDIATSLHDLLDRFSAHLGAADRAPAPPAAVLLEGTTT